MAIEIVDNREANCNTLNGSDFKDGDVFYGTIGAGYEGLWLATYSSFVNLKKPSSTFQRDASCIIRGAVRVDIRIEVLRPSPK